MHAIPFLQSSWAFSIASSIISDTPNSLQTADFGSASDEKWFTKWMVELSRKEKCDRTQRVVRSTFQDSWLLRAVIIVIFFPRSWIFLTPSTELGTIGTDSGESVDFPYPSHIVPISSEVILFPSHEASCFFTWSIDSIWRSFPWLWAYDKNHSKVLARVSSRSRPMVRWFSQLSFFIDMFLSIWKPLRKAK